MMNLLHNALLEIRRNLPLDFTGFEVVSANASFNISGSVARIDGVRFGSDNKILLLEGID